MSDKDLQAQLDAATAENKDLTDSLKAATEENDGLKEQLEAANKSVADLQKRNSELELAANKGVAAPPPGPPVAMVHPTGASVNVGGIRKYAAEAGEIIKVAAEHAAFLLAHGFRHASPQEVAAAPKAKK